MLKFLKSFSCKMIFTTSSVTTVKNLKIRTTEKFAVITVWFYDRVVCPKDADEMEISVDPDPRGAV